MLKPGTIIESYQGRFAQVVTVKGSRYGLTGWVLNKQDAENDTHVVRFLNEYGISQVLKQQDEKKEEKKAKTTKKS